jgi:hypothetical protein
VLPLRREQLKAFARAEQPPLFELRVDRRPEPQRTAAGRYLEPSLFTRLLRTARNLMLAASLIDR